MAAAADRSVDATLVASPELALVDSELACELRRRLRIPSEQARASSSIDVQASAPRSTTAQDAVIDVIDDIVVAIAPSRPVAIEITDGAGSVDDVIAIAEPQAVRPVSTPALAAPHDLVVESATELRAGADVHTSDDAQTHESSHYPSLPAIDPATSHETEAALQRIRQQLAAESAPAPSRRIRRAFTVASGLVATYAIACIAAALSYGLT